MACICDWPDECSGLGIIECDGCGGDLCVCACGGERECHGCDYCADGEDIFGIEDDEDEDESDA